ncbi:MAG: flagellar M-ring protein FliF C-terminal domain-containing protein, partial [Vibrio sp.]
MVRFHGQSNCHCDQHLSVSVLINGKPEQYSKAELDQMTTMLQDALGLRSANGDQISLHVFP